MYYYKFVQWDASPIEEVLTGRTPAALQAWDDGNKKPLRDLHLVLDAPIIKIGGWAFPLHKYLKRYWIYLRGYGINEFYALNKTDIRKRFGCNVTEIVEVGYFHD